MFLLHFENFAHVADVHLGGRLRPPVLVNDQNVLSFGELHYQGVEGVGLYAYLLNV